ncbi:MAG: hypothetical protein AAFN05_10320, partial [Pseudomonadota bacterium]
GAEIRAARCDGLVPGGAVLDGEAVAAGSVVLAAGAATLALAGFGAPPGEKGQAAVLAGTLPVVRFVWFFLQGDGEGRLQSLVIGGVFVVVGFITLTLALLADAVAMNRRLLEQTLRSVRRLELGAQGMPADEGAAEAPAAGETPPELPAERPRRAAG